MVNSVAFSPDGSKVVSGDDSGGVVLWDAPSLTQVHTASVPGGVNRVLSVSFAPDGSKVVSGDVSGAVVLWDAPRLTQVHTASVGGVNRVSSVAFSPHRSSSSREQGLSIAALHVRFGQGHIE